MSKYLYRIFIGAALFGMVNMTAMADMNEAPAPAQHFQQATTAANADQSAATATKPNKLNKQSTNDVAATTQTAIVDQQSASVLQAELTQLNQNTVLYQQKTDAEFEDLSNKNQMMQEQLQQLTQALGLMNQEVMHLKQMNEALHQVADKQASAASSFNLKQWLNDWQNKLGTLGIWIAAIIVILLLIWILWPRRKKISPIIAAEDDTKVEYDYMGSNESIPAKLNLARAYIAMEDYVAARTVLDEVTQFGNREQQAQADEMRKLIPAEL